MTVGLIVVADGTQGADRYVTAPSVAVEREDLFLVARFVARVLAVELVQSRFLHFTHRDHHVFAGDRRPSVGSRALRTHEVEAFLAERGSRRLVGAICALYF